MVLFTEGKLSIGLPYGHFKQLRTLLSLMGITIGILRSLPYYGTRFHGKKYANSVSSLGSDIIYIENGHGCRRKDRNTDGGNTSTALL